MKRSLLYISIVIVISALLYFYDTQTPKALARCPEDYAETDAGFEDKGIALDKWINDFYDKYPNASLSDFARARYDFYIQNNCDKTLQRYYEAKEGKGDPEEMKIIRDTIQEEMHNQAMKNMINALKDDESRQQTQ